MNFMKKSLSNEAIRSLLQHIMFGVLFVLIILNWSVHKPMDYQQVNEALDRSIRIWEGLTIDDLNYSKDEIFRKDSNTIQLQNIVLQKTGILLERIKTFEDKVNGNFNTDKSEILIEYRSLIEKVLDYNNSLIEVLGLEKNATHDFLTTLTKAKLDHYYNVTGHLGYLSKDGLMSILKALKSDIYFTKSSVIDFLAYRYVVCDLGVFFDNYHAYCMNPYFFIFENQIFHSEIFFGSSIYRNKSVEQEWTIKVSEGIVDMNDDDGYFNWESKGIHLGKNTVNGSITRMYKNDTITRPFSFSYFVSAPGIAFHLDKANVCYVGVPNRVSINIPGYEADKIKLRVAGAKVSKAGAGQFDIFISKMPAGKVYAYVDATNAQGRTSTVHSMELKLQHLPAPLTNFEAYKENGIALADFKAQKTLQLFPADTAFAIDYSVVSFEVECINARHQYTEGIEVKGADFETNVELQKLIASAQSGDRFIFSRIIAKAANGLSYEVLPVSVFIKDTP